MIPVCRTLNAYLRTLAKEYPEKKLLGGAGGWLTAAQVLDRVENAARHLWSMGIRPGDLAAVRTRRSVETAVMLLALQRVGAVAAST